MSVIAFYVYRCVEVGNGFSPLSVVHNGKHVCHSVERSMQAHRARKVPLGLDMLVVMMPMIKLGWLVTMNGN